jgi:hypothetical protein
MEAIFINIGEIKLTTAESVAMKAERWRGERRGERLGGGSNP